MALFNSELDLKSISASLKALSRKELETDLDPLEKIIHQGTTSIYFRLKILLIWIKIRY